MLSRTAGLARRLGVQPIDRAGSVTHEIGDGLVDRRLALRPTAGRREIERLIAEREIFGQIRPHGLRRRVADGVGNPAVLEEVAEDVAFARVAGLAPAPRADGPLRLERRECRSRTPVPPRAGLRRRSATWREAATSKTGLFQRCAAASPVSAPPPWPSATGSKAAGRAVERFVRSDRRRMSLAATHDGRKAVDRSCGAPSYARPHGLAPLVRPRADRATGRKE